MKYARIIDGNVLEIIQPPAGYSIEECYHEGVVKTCVEIPADLDVQIGWTHSSETGFVAPAPAEPPAAP